jgi:hypothetical protein
VTLWISVQLHHVLKLFRLPCLQCHAIITAMKQKEEVDPENVPCETTTYPETPHSNNLNIRRCYRKSSTCIQKYYTFFREFHRRVLKDTPLDPTLIRNTTRTLAFIYCKMQFAVILSITSRSPEIFTSVAGRYIGDPSPITSQCI